MEVFLVDAARPVAARVGADALSETAGLSIANSEVVVVLVVAAFEVVSAAAASILDFLRVDHLPLGDRFDFAPASSNCFWAIIEFSSTSGT